MHCWFGLFCGQWLGWLSANSKINSRRCSQTPQLSCRLLRKNSGYIALSSGEAELYAIGQGISETLYVRNLILDAELARKVKLHIYTDSTAGKSMATRFGSGKKTKHVELRFLYMQDLVVRGDPQIRKVHTTENCADPFTKYLDTETLKSHLGRLCVETVFRCFDL